MPKQATDTELLDAPEDPRDALIEQQAKEIDQKAAEIARHVARVAELESLYPDHMGPTGFARVMKPMISPQACVICHSASGPLIDTLREGVASGPAHSDRLYLCAMCVKLASVEMGLIEGERMTELLASSDLLDAAKADLADRDQLIQSQMSELAARARKIEALDELLQQANDREKTRKHLIEMLHENSGQLLSVGV